MEDGMDKKYIVRLTSEERSELADLIKTGKTSAYRIKHANILMAIDANGQGWTNKKTAEAYRCHSNTVLNIGQRFVEQGFEAAMDRKKQEAPSRECLLDGEKEARLIAVACSAPPEGRSKWTLQLLADKLVALEVVGSISGQTVRRTLKKTHLSLT
jgi:transposase